MNLDELERQMRLELIDDEPRAAVAGIHDNFQRLELRDIDVGQQMRDIGCAWCRCCCARRRLAAFGNCAAFGKARISFKPLSALMGLDCSRTNFMPL